MAVEPGKTNKKVSKLTILTAIAKGAGDTADGTTKGQIVDWIAKNIGHKKDSALKSTVEKLVKDAKKNGILIRGKNASRYKLADPTSKEYEALRKSKVERAVPKAVAPNKNSNKKIKKSTPIPPPKPTPTKQQSRIYTDDPFNCHDELHPDYDTELCEPKMDGTYVIGICELLVGRKTATDSSGLPANEKRFGEYKFCVAEFQKDERYKSRYYKRHKIPPVILQKIASLYPY